MATAYTEVYDFFLMKVSDYDFLELTEDELKGDLEMYMRSAIVKFRQSNVDLKDRDEVLKRFNNTLGDEEKEILSMQMVLEYLKPQINHSKNRKQILPDRDYKIYSQKSHLDGMIALQKELQAEVSQAISDYTYANGLTELD